MRIRHGPMMFSLLIIAILTFLIVNVFPVGATGYFQPCASATSVLNSDTADILSATNAMPAMQAMTMATAVPKFYMARSTTPKDSVASPTAIGLNRFYFITRLTRHDHYGGTNLRTANFMTIVSPANAQYTPSQWHVLRI